MRKLKIDGEMHEVVRSECPADPWVKLRAFVKPAGHHGGPTSQHDFEMEPRAGNKFRTNGHVYEIVL